MYGSDFMLKDNLIKARNSKGYTQNDVAKILNVKRQTYGAYERGVSTPDIETLQKLAEIFGTTIDSLLDKQEPAAEEPSKLEKKLIILSRNAKNMSEEERNELTEYFEKTIDIYLKAKGIDPKDF
jgi:transcriptional regulator with XRE-family HTH domain